MGKRGGGMAIAFLMGAIAALSQEAPDRPATSVADAIAARDAAIPGIWYAKFDVEHEGPAYLFDLPEAEYGQRYRYRNVEEWWADGERCAVRVSRETERYLDDEPLEIGGTPGEPLHAYIHDGSTTIFVDLLYPGNKMVVNSPWPYANAAVPILFGRSFSQQPYGEVVREHGPSLRAEKHVGKACSVVSWNRGRLRVESWLAEDVDYMCVREMAYMNDELILDRVFDFALSSNGRQTPANALERFITADGSETLKSWRLVTLDEAPTLPFFVFNPAERDVALVVDGVTATVLKADPREGTP